MCSGKLPEATAAGRVSQANTRLPADTRRQVAQPTSPDGRYCHQRGEAYTYDGFGNLTGKTPTQGYAPAMTGSADSNATGGALSGQWDVEKRPMTQGVTQATPFYVYDPWGRRVWRQWYDTTYGTTNCEAYFYGADRPEAGELQLPVHLGIARRDAGGDQHVFRGEDAIGEGRFHRDGSSWQRPWGQQRRDHVVLSVGRRAGNGNGG